MRTAKHFALVALLVLGATVYASCPGPANLIGLSLSPDGTRLEATTNYDAIAPWDLRRLREGLTALDFGWAMLRYPSAGHAGEPVQTLTVEVRGVAEQNHVTGSEGKDKNKNRPAPEDEKKVMTGLYNRYCIRCHGLDGRGVWDIPKVPDFTDKDWQASRTDAEMVRAILKGGKGTAEKRRDSLKLPPPSKKTGILHWAVMPSFQGILTQEEASGITRFVRTFGPVEDR
jgi:mono/diheme cytochrome c family protein